MSAFPPPSSTPLVLALHAALLEARALDLDLHALRRRTIQALLDGADPREPDTALLAPAAAALEEAFTAIA